MKLEYMSLYFAFALTPTLIHQSPTPTHTAQPVPLQTDDTKVYHVSVVQSEGGAAASTSLQQMLESFNRLNTTIEAILNLAQPTINEVCHMTRFVLVW